MLLLYGMFDSFSFEMATFWNTVVGKCAEVKDLQAKVLSLCCGFWMNICT